VGEIYLPEIMNIAGMGKMRKALLWVPGYITTVYRLMEPEKQ